jgi:hypothetical protein
MPYNILIIKYTLPKCCYLKQRSSKMINYGIICANSYFRDFTQSLIITYMSETHVKESKF